jgi:hypothetical protein
MVGAAGDHGSHSGPESRNKDHQNVNQQEQYKQNCHYEVQRACSLVASQEPDWKRKCGIKPK